MRDRAEPIPQLAALMFDMDGLMVDTEPLARRGWEMALAPLGVMLDDDTYAAMIGLRSDESAAVLVGRLGLTADPAGLMKQSKQYLRDLMAESVPIMPGLPALFDVLADVGLPWAVATSSPRQVAEFVLERLGMRARCGAVAGGDEVTRGKPAPDVYLLAAERLGVAPGLCLALEDSVPGAQAAANAGMTVVAIPGPHADPADFDMAWQVLPSLTPVAERLPAWLAG